MAESYEGLLIAAPMCLVENTTDGKLLVREDAMNELSKITLPIVVVAIVGPYRTGKSFIMNRLMGQKSGFPLGSTVESTTKGIWAWCRRHPVKTDQCLLLLDTEGLGDIDKGDANNDNWIFALSVLLSSTLVYNSISALNQDALDKIYYVAELTDLIKVRAGSGEENGSEFYKFFPNFVWILRDFTLSLEKEGKPITSDQYLMETLKLRPGVGKRVNEYNLPRECISSFFKEKRCFIFNRPVEQRKLLSRLETITDSELEEEFVKQTQTFCDYIYASSRPKTANGRQINGSMFCRLMEIYVTTIQSRSIPCIERAIDAMATIENKKAVQTALDLYRKKMEASVKLPTSSPDELSRVHQKCNREAFEIFMSTSILDEKQEYQKQLQERLEGEYERICESNRLESRKICQKILESATSQLSHNVAEGIYNKPEGYRDYLRDRERALSSYRKEPGKGIMAEDVLDEFMRERASEADAVLASDQALTAAERKQAADERAAELEKQRTRAVEGGHCRQEQSVRDQEESFQKALELLHQKVVKENENVIQEIQLILAQKEQEYKQAIDDKVEKVIKARDQEISDLKMRLKTKKEEHEKLLQVKGDHNGLVQFLRSIRNWFTSLF